MQRVAREHEPEKAHEVRAPRASEQATARPNPLAWASAAGNQAVQHVARQAVAEAEEHETGPDGEEQEPGPEAMAPQEEEHEEPPPPEAVAAEKAGLHLDDIAGLGAADQLPEDHLPG